MYNKITELKAKFKKGIETYNPQVTVLNVEVHPLFLALLIWEQSYSAKSL